MKKIIDKKIGEILINDISGIKVPLHFINEAILKQKTLKDTRPIGEILVKDGLLSEETVSEALSIQFGQDYIPYLTNKDRIQWDLWRSEDIVNAVPEILDHIKKSRSFPAFYDKDKKLVIMATDPSFFELDLFLVKLKKVAVNGIKTIIVPRYAMLDFDLQIKAITLQELQTEAQNITKATSEEEMAAGEITPARFLQLMLVYAVIKESSDIHIQPAANGFSRLAMRTQGIMDTILYLPIQQMSKIVAAIKNQSKLDPTIVKAPQDGRIDGKELLKNVEFKGSSRTIRTFNFEDVSLRVSTYPTESPYILPAGTSFESVVMRIFNPKSGLVRLSDLGLSTQVSEELMILKERSQGIILITGPTGSGKSTTLYSALGSIDGITKKIITFEDPVELRQLFWAQGQKNLVSDNKRLNFDYPEAIKSMMRQDPDVILLGEIRELQGADFAFKAANTGHMVFSTLHANSSCQAFERLRKIGIDDLMMASGMLAVSAQRLVRKVCNHCGQVVNIKPEWKTALLKLEIPEDKIPLKVTIPSEHGCEMCAYKKYIGRILISEIVPITNKIREAIINKKPDYFIREMADQMGYHTIVEDGLNKLKPVKIRKQKQDGTIVEIETPGETTILELLRVI